MTLIVRWEDGHTSRVPVEDAEQAFGTIYTLRQIYTDIEFAYIQT